MTRRGRYVTYGSAVALVLGGGVCAAALSGVTGQVLAMVLIGVGLVLLTGLVFMEVGLTEDRERDRERQSDRERGARRVSTAPPRPRLEPIRMPRVRGSRHEH